MPSLFCSRSVLVLNVKNFSCSCSVRVREQEQVREHVLEQPAYSFIPDCNELIMMTKALNLRDRLNFSVLFRIMFPPR